MERLKALDMTPRGASIAATGQPDAIRFIFTRGTMPSPPRLHSIAAVLECTSDYLLGLSDDLYDKQGRNLIVARSRVAAQASAHETLHEEGDIIASDIPIFPGIPHARIDEVFQEVAKLDREYGTTVPEPLLPRDIPVYGTAMGDQVEYKGPGDYPVAVEQTTLNNGEVIDYFRRPPALTNNRKIYGLYVAGDSMDPVYESGSPVLVNPSRSPSARDYVVVYLADSSSSDGRTASFLLKRLWRRSPSFLELEQFNPAGTFRVPTDRVQAVHRVISLGEMLGI